MVRMKLAKAKYRSYKSLIKGDLLMTKRNIDQFDDK